MSDHVSFLGPHKRQEEVRSSLSPDLLPVSRPSGRSPEDRVGRGKVSSFDSVRRPVTHRPGVLQGTKDSVERHQDVFLQGVEPALVQGD